MSNSYQVDLPADLAGLNHGVWVNRLEDIAEDHGAYNFLGKQHAAALIDAGPKLLVTFENTHAVVDTAPNAEPLGFRFVREDGWTYLGIFSHADTWFRDPYVYAFFDRLTDDGFFERFDDVLFCGADAGGYAAAAYSVAAPGARVLALRPQATLDPRITGFDSRFRDHRRLDFNSRYGFAPDMVDAATKAYVAFDPLQKQDAMHAALFTRPNVMPLRCNALGAKLDRALDGMGVLTAIVRAAMQGTLNDAHFARLMRARRGYVPYLRKLVAEAMKADRPTLAATVCAHAIKNGHDRFFTDQLADLRDEGHLPFRPDAIKAAE